MNMISYIYIIKNIMLTQTHRLQCLPWYTGNRNKHCSTLGKYICL